MKDNLHKLGFSTFFINELFFCAREVYIWLLKKPIQALMGGDFHQDLSQFLTFNVWSSQICVCVCVFTVTDAHVSTDGAHTHTCRATFPGHTAITRTNGSYIKCPGCSGRFWPSVLAFRDLIHFMLIRNVLVIHAYPRSAVFCVTQSQ